MVQLQSHIWLTASSYMGKYLRISSYFRKPFLTYDLAAAPLWIFLIYEENLIFFFISVLKTLLTEAFDVVDSIDHDEAVGVVILYDVPGGEVYNSWL